MKNKKGSKKKSAFQKNLKGIRRIKPEFERAESVKPHSYNKFPGVAQECIDFQMVSLPLYPQLFKSLSRKTYIYKQDLFVKIQEAAGANFQPYDPIQTLIVYYLRTMVQSLKGRCELVEYDEKPFNDLESKIKKETRELPEFDSKDHDLSVPELIRNVRKELFPENQLDPGYVFFCSAMQTLSEMDEIQDNPFFTPRTLSRFSIVRKVIEKFMKKRPNWFKPNSHGRRTKKPIVRLFTDCLKGENIRFVFDEELSTEMKKAGMTVSKNPTLQMALQKAVKKMGVSLFNDVFSMLQERMKCIEFVQVSMNKIWDDKPSGFKYEPKIGQYLMRILQEEIQEYRIFHGVKRQKAIKILELFDKVVPALERYVIGPCLFNDALYNQVQHHILEWFVPYHNPGNLKETTYEGFTSKDLRREVKRCGLPSALPGIMNYIREGEMIADKVYNDFQYALVTMQTLYITHESPIIQEFFHRTGCCFYMGNNCYHCLRRKEEVKAAKRELRDSRAKENEVEQTGNESEEHAPEEGCHTDCETTSAIKSLRNRLRGAELELMSLKRKSKKTQGEAAESLLAKISDIQAEMVQLEKDAVFPLVQAGLSASGLEVSNEEQLRIMKIVSVYIKKDVTASCLNAKGNVSKPGNEVERSSSEDFKIEQLTTKDSKNGPSTLPISRVTSAGSKAAKNKEKRGRKSANRKLKNLEQEARNDSKHCESLNQKKQTLSQIEDDTEGRTCDNGQFQDLEKMLFEGLLREHAEVGQSSSDSETAPPMDIVDSKGSESKVANNMNEEERQSKEELEQASETEEGKNVGNLFPSTDTNKEDISGPAETEIQLLRKQLKELQWLKFQNEKTIEKLKKDVNARDTVISNYQRATCAEMMAKCGSRSSSSAFLKMSNAFFGIIGQRDILETNHYIEDAREQAYKVMRCSKNEEHRCLAKKELDRVEKEYIKCKSGIDRMVQWGKDGFVGGAAQIPELPQLPCYSDEFLNAFEEVMRMEFLESVEGTRCKASEELSTVEPEGNHIDLNLDDWVESQIARIPYLSGKDLKMSLQMKLRLKELTDHLDNLKRSDPVRKARKMANELTGGTGLPLDVFCQLKEFESSVEKYKMEVERGAKFLLNHPLANVDELPRIPRQPVFRLHIGDFN